MAADIYRSDTFLLNSNQEEGTVTISLSAVEPLTDASGDLVTAVFTVVGGEGTKTPVNIGFVKLSGEFGEDLDWENDVTKSGTSIDIAEKAAAEKSWHLYR